MRGSPTGRTARSTPPATTSSSLPTFYTGTHVRNEGYLRALPALDPSRHFIVSVNLFGNGLTSSPSNTAPPFDGPRFPTVTLHDNVACQHRLLTEGLGVKRIALVFGWSMAGCQAYEWGAQFPDLVDAILPFCASARTSPHNQVFLEGVKAALLADCAFAGGDYASPPEAGLRAFGRVYAGWAYSQAFYRERLHRELGFETWEELLVDWERDHLAWDANDLLAKLRTWQLGDISANERYRGDFEGALGAIRARAILVPLHHRPLLPARGQRDRGRAHAERRAPAVRLAVGPLRGFAEPGRERLPALPRRAGVGAAREVGATRPGGGGAPNVFAGRMPALPGGRRSQRARGPNLSFMRNRVDTSPI